MRRAEPSSIYWWTLKTQIKSILIFYNFIQIESLATSHEMTTGYLTSTLNPSNSAVGLCASFSQTLLWQDCNLWQSSPECRDRQKPLLLLSPWLRGRVWETPPQISAVGRFYLTSRDGRAYIKECALSYWDCKSGAASEVAFTNDFSLYTASLVCAWL